MKIDKTIDKEKEKKMKKNETIKKIAKIYQI